MVFHDATRFSNGLLRLKKERPPAVSVVPSINPTQIRFFSCCPCFTILQLEAYLCRPVNLERFVQFTFGKVVAFTSDSCS